MSPSRGLVAFVVPVLAMAAPQAARDRVCAECHSQQVARFSKTSMATALSPARDSDILRRHATLTFQEAGYTWNIVRDEEGSLMTVSHNDQKVTARLLWAFGRGQAGQTYVYERDGALYESRVSFFNAISGLDLTMGAQGSKPASIEEAAGRRMDAIGARDCFGCHSTGAVSSGRLHLESIVPGVGCESCHGNADKHLAGIRTGNGGTAKMAKLAGQNAEAMSELCGRCHRTWAQIAENGPRGVGNVRFQPYRLANSKCYDATDARLGCTVCHDPHGPLETNAASYDAKCSACHSAARLTRTCRVGKSGCVNCHMPKYELPGAHARFTDHQIRIVRAGEPYPN